MSGTNVVIQARFSANISINTFKYKGIHQNTFGQHETIFFWQRETFLNRKVERLIAIKDEREQRHVGSMGLGQKGSTVQRLNQIVDMPNTEHENWGVSN